MAIKNPFNTPATRKNIVIAFWVAAILLCVEGIRYFVELFVKSLEGGDILAYWLGFCVAIIILTILIVKFAEK